MHFFHNCLSTKGQKKRFGTVFVLCTGSCYGLLFWQEGISKDAEALSDRKDDELFSFSYWFLFYTNVCRVLPHTYKCPVAPWIHAFQHEWHQQRLSQPLFLQVAAGKGIWFICALQHCILHVRAGCTCDSATSPALFLSHVCSAFLTGQQGEIRPVPGEGIQGENKPILHVWRPCEENPRVQAPAAQLPAHHRHVQPYVKSLITKCQEVSRATAWLGDCQVTSHNLMFLMWKNSSPSKSKQTLSTLFKSNGIFPCHHQTVINRKSASSAVLFSATCGLFSFWLGNTPSRYATNCISTAVLAEHECLLTPMQSLLRYFNLGPVLDRQISKQCHPEC